MKARLFVAALLLFPAGLLQAADKRPNILVIMADDLGYGDVSCYGATELSTPNIDQLASEGLRITSGYCAASTCTPTRYSMLPGTYAFRRKGTGLAPPSAPAVIKPGTETVASILQRADYETAVIGKWHLGLPGRSREKPTPKQHGFDYWFATGNNAQPSHKDPVNFIRNGNPVGKIKGYARQIVVNEAISWLDEHRKPAKPFFLNIWFHEPHAPIAAPKTSVAPYGKLNDPAAIYSGTIDNTDRAIARLLKKLKQVDAPENTLIIYSSDNGSYRNDRTGHLRGSKGSNFEGGIRVPGIFYWPGTIGGGRVEKSPAGLVDLLPSVCGLLGIDKPEGVHLDGSDLSPLLRGEPNKFFRHQPLIWLLPTNAAAIALREGKYSLVGYRSYELPKDKQAMASLRKQIEEILRKDGSLEEEIRGSTLQKQLFEGFRNKEAEKLRGKYVRLNMFSEAWIPAIKAGGYQRFQLFDLEKDPSQKTEVSGQHPEIFTRLKKQLMNINASIMADAPDWSKQPGPTE